MAHLVKLGALTDELVTLLTSTSAKNESARFNAHRESALRALRHNSYPRTNQFDIVSRLDGLEEKFRVYNEDPLADALRERLDKLSKKEVKWAPEILHLLLELSDRPLSKSKLEDLDFLIEPEPNIEPPLRWKDLAAEDPLLRDKNIWKNVDFGAGSSDEDEFEDSRSEISGTTETDQSSVDEDTSKRPEDYAVEITDHEDLERLREAQFWLKNPNVGGVKLETVKKPITELHAVREVLFMLAGYPTSLFETKPKEPAAIVPSKNYALKHASGDAFYKLAKDLADYGSSLMGLREWAKRPQSIPLLQVFNGSILARVTEFENHLSSIQQRFVEPREDVLVSLLSVQAEIKPYVEPLIRLSGITKKLDAEPYSHAFRYLELLYDETCTSQMAGNDQTYAFMGDIFFECFQIYLRPIRIWMEDGELSQGDKIFFISEASGQIELAALWESRYKLRQTQSGILHAPSFLTAAASKIFTTGKSVVVLKHLNQYPLIRSFGSSLEPLLDFQTVCEPSKLQLAPFQELFDVAFDAWIQSKHQYASSTLRKILFDSCGLHTSLEAMSQIYFMADGSAGAAFTNPLFDKLDTLDTSWNDRFTLTELVRSAFGVLQSTNPDRLRINLLPLSRRSQDPGKCRRTVKALSIIQLKYHLSWPIQTIITPETNTSYQRIFTFLFQIRRSSHILHRQRLVADILTSNSSSDERALYYSLRTRLLWFIQTLQYYVTCLVLDPGSHKMREALKAAIDVDNMIDAHSNFIKSIVDQALLGQRLELIHKTILKILDLAIKLEDAQAANAIANKEFMERQQEMMEHSMAGLGLQTPRKGRQSMYVNEKDSKDEAESSDDEGKEIDVDLSILSVDDGQGEVLYEQKLRTMKADFDRLVRFVASGLKGVARAGSGADARSWDTLGEMLESGLGSGTMGRY
ncbi:Gamma-tubulin complex component [Lachnellula occidentalis]|uniref:Spindle pole body component n=1 Tax=Lachnellula occidentalis TaxID=215460 RepID=A0A8H8UK44_9HELO|nr:Gamma-tubulin complex component [Lachnellula occidentalis]